MTQPTKPENEFRTFIASLREELIAMSDEEVLEGTDIEQLRSRRARMLDAAKKEAGRQRLAAAKTKIQTNKDQQAGHAPVKVEPAEARRYIAAVANDERYTLAARQLGQGLTDEEAIRLYLEIKSLEAASEPNKGEE
jgi:hypothetical protein